MSSAPAQPGHAMLEPGALFQGALFRDLLRSSEIHLEPGTRFGVFKLVRELGRGGMGVVWLAERDDGEYRQQVAIKCITDRRSARGAELFRKERQILAELRHPNIARLLEGGRREDGVLWFAMELIEGVAIDRHASESALTLDARLRLFTTVVDAVGVAHARFVIHCDLKPSNVLVDSDGRAKLLDFGIASIAADDDAVRAYSPGWASPEQRADTDVGAASDQFQLGLLLDAVLRRAEHPANPGADGEPIDPARWIAMPRHRERELRAVLARVCAAAPEARYRSVGEFGLELERMLARLPIVAAPARGTYPLACAMRRRPGVFAATALSLLVVALLIGAFTARLAREVDLSRAAAVRAEAQAERATREAATSQAINRFLNEDLLSAADPYGENLKDAPMGEVVERAVPRVAARLGSQPAVAGEVYATLGRMLLNLGRTGPARTTLDQASTLLAKVHGADSRQSVDTRLLRAEVEEYAGQYDENERLLTILRADLSGLDPGDIRVIRVDRHLAWAAFLVGRFDRAESRYRELLARTAGSAALSELDRAELYGGHSVALTRLDRGAEALDAATRAHAIRLRALGPDHPLTLQSSLHVATALLGLDRLPEALVAYRDLHQRALARFGVDHNETVVLAHELGVALIRHARPAEALEYLEPAAAAKSAAQGDRAGSAMNTISWLGLAYLRAGRIDDAEAAFNRIAAFQSTSDFDRRAEIGLRRNIGELRLAQRRPADALASCGRGAQIAAALLEASHPLRASVDACRGIALIEVGRRGEGYEVLRSVREPLRAAGSQASTWAVKAEDLLRADSSRTRDEAGGGR